MSTLRIFTVGHGARPLEQLLAVLADGGVERVADVRRYPGSRRHPHFARAALEASLPAAGIAYEWWGEDLGGRRQPVEPSRHPEWRDASFRGFADHMDPTEFALALDRLLSGTARTPTAIMCAETLWWRCHRRLIADSVTARGHEVVHLLDVGKRQAHPESLA